MKNGSRLSGSSNRLLGNIQQYAVGIGEGVLADGAGLKIFLHAAALRSAADFFRRAFGMFRRDSLQVFFRLFDVLDLEADMIEALP
jgi:hypothetical protein